MQRKTPARVGRAMHVDWCAHRCGRKRRTGGIFCTVCYHALPQPYRRGLWNKNLVELSIHIKLCRNWLDENGIPGDKHREIRKHEG